MYYVWEKNLRFFFFSKLISCSYVFKCFLGICKKDWLMKIGKIISFYGKFYNVNSFKKNKIYLLIFCFYKFIILGFVVNDFF